MALMGRAGVMQQRQQQLSPVFNIRIMTVAFYIAAIIAATERRIKFGLHPGLQNTKQFAAACSLSGVEEAVL